MPRMPEPQTCSKCGTKFEVDYPRKKRKYCDDCAPNYRHKPKWAPTQEHIAKAEALAAAGCTLHQIAYSLGIHHETFAQKRRVFKELEEAIERGKEKGIAKVANKLFQKATSGDTTAMIFFLKARGGWTDRQVVEHSGQIDVNNTIEVEKATLSRMAEIYLHRHAER